MALNPTYPGLQTYTVTTTDNSYNQAFSVGLSSYTPAATSGALVCRMLIICINPANGAKAFWDQKVLVDMEDGEGSIHGSLPTADLAAKDLSLVTTDYNADVSDNSLVITVRGIASTTLEWAIWTDIYAARMPES